MANGKRGRRTIAERLADEERINPRENVEFDMKLGETICARIADGGKLSDICRSEGMPGYRTVCHWRRVVPEFATMYELARHDRVERYADEVVEISDDSTADRVVTEEGERVDHENIQRARLRVDTRKWLAARLLPRVYGDKMLHTGADGQGPIQVQDLHLDYSKLDLDELAEFRRLLLKASGGPAVREASDSD